jgi:2-methylisocitrate lyase-like PEP mutase family enzyme
MPDTLLQKTEHYRVLHAAAGAFVAGGCWDAGSAMILAHAGLRVLETSSAGVMFARGLPDGDGLATRDLMLENARSIAAAVDIPVTADLENGFGLQPEVVAETIRLAGETGIVGGSIEDTSGDRTDPILPLGLAVDRIRAAAEAARRLPFPFALTARADQYMHKRRDLAGTIQRAQEFQAAGADMILVPGLTGREEIEALCRSVDCPVAVVVGLSDYRPNLAAFGALGVRRVIVGSSLARIAYTGILKAVREMTEIGTFGFTEGLMPFDELNELFRRLHAGPVYGHHVPGAPVQG